jgi:hypothetical protein
MSPKDPSMTRVIGDAKMKIFQFLIINRWGDEHTVEIKARTRNEALGRLEIGFPDAVILMVTLKA